ncbi:hypothetical protein K9N68_02360 [Kovacikia minuta CCNUW1]|uniref:hypothetical protein n=1 Tax=Kovacikia minuta TaxID=2931930 RepID=UPI001CD01A78|nr:hypothetical protein [Kovacikia minuta]UBF26853.1 hypothetical protein K9N68_02360 [Kovacikia minuta CCNUW1]
MKVLELTPNRLVIKDGSRWYKSYLIHNLLDEKWHKLVNIFSGVITISLGIAWIAGKIPQNLQPASMAVLFLLAAPLILDITTGERTTPIYRFDKSSGQMTVTNGKFVQRFALTDVVDVVAVNTESIDPPPTYWREIHLILRSKGELKLHPGHEDAQKQEELTLLLRQFLDLN